MNHEFPWLSFKKFLSGTSLPYRISSVFSLPQLLNFTLWLWCYVSHAVTKLSRISVFCLQCPCSGLHSKPIMYLAVHIWPGGTHNFLDMACLLVTTCWRRLVEWVSVINLVCWPQVIWSWTNDVCKGDNWKLLYSSIVAKYWYQVTYQWICL